MIQFRKIDKKDQKLIDILNKYSGTLKNYADYIGFLSVQKGAKNSGAATSYKNSLARLIVLYEENFDNQISDINTIDAFNQLNKLRDSPNYDSYNKNSDRFPNAALNAYETFLFHQSFIREQQRDNELNYELLYVNPNQSLKVATTAVPKGKKVKKIYGETYDRSIHESLNAKVNANWSCEYDKTHDTFISEINGKPYVEAHHLIPMSSQDLFDNTIDFSDNIISLCPNCHRRIHYGKKLEKEKMLEYFYYKRCPLFLNYGIDISLDKLKKIYNI